jgi:hypothetical protein
MKKITVVTYRRNGTQYQHTFSGHLLTDTIEQKMIMDLRIGRSQFTIVSHVHKTI